MFRYFTYEKYYYMVSMTNLFRSSLLVVVDDDNFHTKSIFGLFVFQIWIFQWKREYQDSELTGCLSVLMRNSVCIFVISCSILAIIQVNKQCVYFGVYNQNITTIHSVLCRKNFRFKFKFKKWNFPWYITCEGNRFNRLWYALNCFCFVSFRFFGDIYSFFSPFNFIHFNEFFSFYFKKIIFSFFIWFIWSIFSLGPDDDDHSMNGSIITRKFPSFFLGYGRGLCWIVDEWWTLVVVVEYLCMVCVCDGHWFWLYFFQT